MTRHSAASWNWFPMKTTEKTDCLWRQSNTRPLHCNSWVVWATRLILQETADRQDYEWISFNNIICSLVRTFWNISCLLFFVIWNIFSAFEQEKIVAPEIPITISDSTISPLGARLERPSAFFPVMELPGRLNLTGFVSIFDWHPVVVSVPPLTFSLLSVASGLTYIQVL